MRYGGYVHFIIDVVAYMLQIVNLTYYIDFKTPIAQPMVSKEHWAAATLYL